MLVENRQFTGSTNVQEVNTWQVVSILYKTFKNIYLEIIQEDNAEKIYLKIQSPNGRYWKVSGVSLQEALSRIIALAWQEIPEESKTALEDLKNRI